MFIGFADVKLIENKPYKHIYLGTVPDNGVQAHLVVRSLKLLSWSPTLQTEVYLSEWSTSLFFFFF